MERLARESWKRRLHFRPELLNVGILDVHRLVAELEKDATDSPPDGQVAMVALAIVAQHIAANTSAAIAALEARIAALESPP